MKKDNGGKDKNSIGEDSYKKLEAMDNKLDKIRSDTHNLNRINTLANKPSREFTSGTFQLSDKALSSQ